MGASLLIALAAIIFVVGLVFAMFGQGGGSFFVPIMVAFGVPFHRAATASLFILMATSVSAALVYWRSKMIDWKLALVVDPITDLMAFVAGYFAIRVPGSTLKILFALVLVLASYFMFRPVSATRRPSGRRFGLWRRRFGGHDYSVNLLAAIPLSGAAGVVAGLLGISGGLFKVPLLVLLCGVPLKVAIATSSFMVALTGLGGFLGHSLSESVDWRLALVLAAAAFAGGSLGARISLKTDKARLKKLFGALLVLVSAWMIYNALTGS